MRVSLHAIVRQHLPAFLRLNNDLDIKTVLAFNTKSPKSLMKLYRSDNPLIGSQTYAIRVLQSG